MRCYFTIPRIRSKTNTAAKHTARSRPHGCMNNAQRRHTQLTLTATRVCALELTVDSAASVPFSSRCCCRCRCTAAVATAAQRMQLRYSCCRFCYPRWYRRWQGHDPCLASTSCNLFVAASILLPLLEAAHASALVGVLRGGSGRLTLGVIVAPPRVQ